MQKASRFLVAAFLCFALAPPAHAEPLIAHARQLEKARDSEGAAKLLSAWLAMNPGAPGGAAVFSTYMRLEQNLAELFEASDRFLQSAKGTPGAAAQFEKIARLFDLAGRTEEARNAYIAAHDEGATDATIVSAFLLSLQMNDVETMSSCIQKMSAKGETTELFLRALSDVGGADPAAARAQLTGLADQTGNPDVALKAMWVLYQAARRSGDSAGQAALRAKMAGRFAAAPETALAGGQSAPGPAPRATVIPMPAPGPFEAGAGQTQPAQQTQQSVQTQPAQPPVQSPVAVPDTTPTARPDLPSSPPVSVQAGSFAMKENADDLLSELRRRGFDAVVIHESAPGKDRYRVLVGTGLPIDAARGILKKLSDAGFRGFLIQDKEAGVGKQ
jgi:cell division septation protein DedD